MYKKYLLLDLLHIRCNTDILINFVMAAIGFVLAKFKIIVLNESMVFIAVAVIVGIDFVAGVTNAIVQKNFESNKAKKVIYYLVTYWSIAGACLVLQYTFKSAFWLVEAIMFPLLFVQLISAVKNFNKAGIIKSKQLDSILSHVDKHKDENF